MNKAFVYWYCGLSGSGKTTVTNEVIKMLDARSISYRILDGDIVREKYHQKLGFSKPDILENNRLISEICVNAQDKYDVILVPIISPFNESREKAKQIIGDSYFRLIYFSASLETVSQRDVKGLYKKAKDGIITNLIGFNKCSPFEVPLNYDLAFDSGQDDMTPVLFADNLFKLIEKDLNS